jgi:hypothetical protein
MKKSKRVSGSGRSEMSVKRTKLPAGKSAVRTKASKNGVGLETKEERERRMAKLEALTIRAFQMAYDNHHSS